MACEDFPCCGHEAGDCPTRDSKGRERWKCVDCGKRLSVNATSSLCEACKRRLRKHPDYEYGGA
jgi:transposase-like protein